MIIGKNKWVLFKFIPYEYKALEKYLEKMALMGWELKEMSGYFLKFDKVEPKAVKYSVEVIDKISMFVGNDSKSEIECREYCEAAGWTFICQRDKIQVYSKDNGFENIPIQADEEEKYKTIFKESLKYCILNVIAVFIMLWSQYTISFGSLYAEFLADNSMLLLLLISGLWLIQESVQFIHFLIWAFKGKQSLKRHDEVSYDFKIITNIKLAFNKIMFLLLLAMLLLLITSGLIGRHIINFILVLAISIVLGISLVKFVRKSGYEEKIRKLINILGIIIIIVIDLVIFSRMTITIGGTSTVGFNNDGEYTLTLEDFNDDSEDYNYKYTDKKKSILASYESYFDKGEETYISYDLYKSKYKLVINYILRKEIEKLNKYDGKVALIENNIYNDIKLYQSDNEDRFVLVSDNIFISIYIKNNKLSKNEILQLIYRNVFKSVS